MADTPKADFPDKSSHNFGRSNMNFSNRDKLIDLNKAHKDKESQIVNDTIILNNQTIQSTVHHSSKIKQFVECSIEKRSCVKKDNGNSDKQMLIDEVDNNKSLNFKQRIINNPHNSNNTFF